MKYKKVMALLLSTIVVTCTAAAFGTKAYFTDKSQSVQNTFKTGTLILGSGDSNSKDNDKMHEFQKIDVSNIQPSLELREYGTTKLKNVGTLPMKLYRITASDVVDDNPEIDANLAVQIEINGQKVYYGRIKDLKEENGGYFDPIYNIAPQQQVELKVSVKMNSLSTNDRQDKKLIYNLNVFAAQNNMPNNGEPMGVWQGTGKNRTLVGTWTDMGTSAGAGTEQDPKFSVTGINDSNYVYFKYKYEPNEKFQEMKWIEWDDWFGHHKILGTPHDRDVEVYRITIKHLTGDPTAQIYEKLDITGKWNIGLGTWEWNVDPKLAGMVDIDFKNDIITINKNAFPREWDGFQVEFRGIQRENMPERVITYNWWSLNRK